MIHSYILFLNRLDFWINFASNSFTILASGVVIYLFLANKNKITSVINNILNYSYQLTLSELKYKIERLNDYNTNDPTSKVEIVNILHEIEGQIIGNKLLTDALSIQLEKVKFFTRSSKTLSEAKKRSLVSELRESIRTLDAIHYDKISKSKSTN